MNGAGNDFVVIDEASFVELDPSAAFRRALCDRRRGVGADGILVVGRDDDADFSVAFYNADGEPGSMCGNGARCALRFAREVGFAERARVEFLFGSERIVGEIEDVARPAVSLPDPSGRPLRRRDRDRRRPAIRRLRRHGLAPRRLRRPRDPRRERRNDLRANRGNRRRTHRSDP